MSCRVRRGPGAAENVHKKEDPGVLVAGTWLEQRKTRNVSEMSSRARSTMTQRSTETRRGGGAARAWRARWRRTDGSSGCCFLLEIGRRRASDEKKKGVAAAGREKQH
jgi:hypothetical protein